jgi:hypothetical protein
MADFAQTMKDWRRMCSAMKQENEYTACDKCDLQDFDCPAIYLKGCDNANWKHVEDVVKAWAAEHPEPIYELWGEWFEKRGDLIRGWHNATNIQWIAKTFGRLMCTPIPAEIAQKLGIEPKE